MALTNWHYGKLIILWAWGALSTALSWYIAVGLEPASDDSVTSILGLIALAFIFLIPACLSIVTWKWLGGMEGEVRASEGSTEAPSDAT